MLASISLWRSAQPMCLLVEMRALARKMSLLDPTPSQDSGDVSNIDGDLREVLPMLSQKAPLSSDRG